MEVQVSLVQVGVEVNCVVVDECVWIVQECVELCQEIVKFEDWQECFFVCVLVDGYIKMFG